MDQVLRTLLEQVSPGLAVYLAIVVLAFVAIAYVFRAWNAWIDARSGKHALEIEKTRLELLKLRYEIQSIIKEFNLSPLDETFSARAKQEQRAAATSLASSPRFTRQWRWVYWLSWRHRVLPNIALGGLLLIASLVVTVFLLTGTIGLLVLFIGSSNPWSDTLLVTLIDFASAFAVLRLSVSLWKQWNLFRLSRKRKAAECRGT